MTTLRVAVREYLSLRRGLAHVQGLPDFRRVSLYGVRIGILASHYVTVSGAWEHAGGFVSRIPKAFSTCRARGDPRLTPWRSG